MAQKDDGARPLTDEDVRRLEAALAVMRRRFADGVGLDEVARAAHWSPLHFHRLFRRWHGKTPKQVMTELQIEQAKRMLLAGEPMKTIARSCGFAHQSHFTARFAMMTTVSPGRWLRRVRAGTLAA